MTALRLPIALLCLAMTACAQPVDAPPDARPFVELPTDCRPLPFEDPIESLTVFIDAEPGPDLDLVRNDLSAFLSEIFEQPIAASFEPPPDDGAQVILRIDAQTQAVHIRRTPGGVEILGHDRAHLAHGAYFFLEALGVRFFHPRETYVPRHATLALPRELEIVRAPMTRTRGSQLHTLHPIEYFNALNGDDELVAEQLIDWHVRTGQNHLQWPVLATMDFDVWSAHARAIIDYAHTRHVRMGVVLALFGRTSLQKNFVLADDRDAWQPQLESNLDAFVGYGFDHFELVMGEFLSEDPEYLIALLDHSVAHLASRNPAITVSVTNHVGEFDNLYVDFRGERTYLYFVPQHADPRLINSVHTVFFFDLFRDWAMYGHDNFSGHREFLFENLGRRPMSYKPESAYWVTADVDVPAFIPEYYNARWIDVHELDARIRAEGLPPLEGHVMFSSGHEWGYWLTDYLTAHLLWRPQAPRSEISMHYAGAFGTCANSVATTFDAYVDLQTKYLFDARLVPYISGEDLHDDLGAVAGVTTHPPRVRFQDAYDFSPAERDAFRAGVVHQLERMVEESTPMAAAIAAVCVLSTDRMRPWCQELLDGIQIVELRLQHSAQLYRAVLHRRGEEADAALEAAARTRELAATIVRGREQSYRFDQALLTNAFDNPTFYNFGYLRQAGRLCYWERQAQQAEHVIRNGGRPSLITELPSCLD